MFAGVGGQVHVIAGVCLCLQVYVYDSRCMFVFAGVGGQVYVCVCKCGWTGVCL